MDLNLKAISLIYLFGALQGLILMIGLNLKKPLNGQLKRIASSLIFAMVVVLVYYFLIINQIGAYKYIIHTVGSICWMAIAPLYYLLFKNLIEGEKPFQLSDWIYFGASLIFIIESILVLFKSSTNLASLINSNQLYLDLWMAIFFSTSIYFIIKSLNLLVKQKDKRNQIWIPFSYLFLAVMSGFIVCYGMIRSNYLSIFEYVMIAVYELFIFILMYKIFMGGAFQQIFDFSKYSNSNLNPGKLTQYAEKLEQIMLQQKPYLNRKLTLGELSKISAINANDLSQLFTIHYKSNFYQFVNNYRLTHLENRIDEGDFKQYKITALAEESGFNSMATFYKVFKEKHQVTPSQFLKKNEVGK